MATLILAWGKVNKRYQDGERKCRLEGVKGLKRPGSLMSTTRNCTYFIRMVNPPKNAHSTPEGVLDACLTEGISNHDRLEEQIPSNERTTVGAEL